MTTPDAISLADKLAAFSEQWNPRIAARDNDNEVRIAKVWAASPGTAGRFLP